MSSSSSQRILIVRVGAMGDVLHALPAVAALRRQWPQAEIDWAVDTRWAPLLVDAEGLGPVVTQVHQAETRLWSRTPLSMATLRSITHLRRDLRQRPYDHVVDMQGTLRSAVIGRLAAGKSLTGFADPREAAARAFYTRRLQRRGAHVVEQGAALLGDALGITLQPTRAELPHDTQAEAWVEATLKAAAPGERLALLAPTAGWGAKQWPAEHFGALAQALHARGWTVLINAAALNDPTCAAVIAASRGAATLVPSSLPRLVALLRRSGVVVGGDSGPVHLAAALGAPLVALFGPTDPARNGPWGPGPMAVLRHPASMTSYKRSATPDPGLAQLGVEQVLAAIASLPIRRL